MKKRVIRTYFVLVFSLVLVATNIFAMQPRVQSDVQPHKGSLRELSLSSPRHRLPPSGPPSEPSSGCALQVDTPDAFFQGSINLSSSSIGSPRALPPGPSLPIGSPRAAATCPASLISSPRALSSGSSSTIGSPQALPPGSSSPTSSPVSLDSPVPLSRLCLSIPADSPSHDRIIVLDDSKKLVGLEEEPAEGEIKQVYVQVGRDIVVLAAAYEEFVVKSKEDLCRLKFWLIGDILPFVFPVEKECLSMKKKINTLDLRTKVFFRDLCCIHIKFLRKIVNFLDEFEKIKNRKRLNEFEEELKRRECNRIQNALIPFMQSFPLAIKFYLDELKRQSKCKKDIMVHLFYQDVDIMPPIEFFEKSDYYDSLVGEKLYLGFLEQLLGRAENLIGK